MATQQTVYRLAHRRDISGLTPHLEDIPSPGQYEVLIKIRSVAINYRDIAIATSAYPFPVKENLIPCSDLAGEIVQVGDGVHELIIGDSVVAAFDPTVLYAISLVKLPPNGIQKYGEWASLVCTGVTAWNSLFGNMPLKPGQSVLCQGTGGVSITTLIIAKAAGATVIITSSSNEKLQLVKAKFGADYLINYKTTPEWAEEALSITRRKGVDFVIDNGGSGTIAQSIKAIAHGGIVSCVGFLSPERDAMPDVARLALSKGAVVRGIQVGSKQMLEEVVRFIAVRQLRIPIGKEFEFDGEQVVEAYKF